MAEAPAQNAGQASCFRYAFAILWALSVGASVALQLCCSVIINSKAPDATANALFVTNIQVALGGVMLLPRLVSATPCRKPGRWWSVLGGVCGSLGFVAAPAGAQAGVQVVLLVQLLAMLSTAFVFDFRRGTVSLSDFTRLSGFLVVVAGVAIENVGALKDPGAGSTSGSGSLLSTLILLLAVACSGVGYALQAKCNARLARDLGSTARSTAFSATVTVLTMLPIMCYMVVGRGIRPVFNVKETWYLWCFSGFQSAFYIGSLASLPKVLGYTTSYLTLLVGKLVASSIIDNYGWAGKVHLFDWERALALSFVFFGTALFSRTSTSAPPRQQEGVAEVTSCHPSFVDGATCDDGDDASRAQCRELIEVGDGERRV
eukprot:TRINITY_DN11081_c0_g1_i2.p1 TRINITY_DN11081_c0_g1~~TRINITY_DN11081_c0_g1_i2.p1  ORF type:complete len:374 (+),score=79.32 TRINITY_DN11081_c0_g1_i2:905-2026(+)